MSQILYTQSIEAATLSLTASGSDSDAKLLKRRDLRMKGINASNSTATVTLEMDFGSSHTADYVIIGNGYATANPTVTVDYWNGSSWVNVYSGSQTLSNTNNLITFTSNSGTKWRIQFARGSATVLQVACIFIGAATTLPVNYQFEGQVVPFMRGEGDQDAYGYPHVHMHNTTTKYRWNVEYRLTGSQKSTVATALAYSYFGGRPFFWYDSNHDSNYHLVKWQNPFAMDDTHIAADYHRVPFVLEEL